MKEMELCKNNWEGGVNTTTSMFIIIFIIAWKVLSFCTLSMHKTSKSQLYKMVIIFKSYVVHDVMVCVLGNPEKA